MLSLMHPWYLSCAYACNRCAWGSDPTGIRGSGSRGSAAPAIGAIGAGIRRSARRCRGGLSGSHALQLRERPAPEHYKPPNFWNPLEYICYIYIDALSYRCWLKNNCCIYIQSLFRKYTLSLCRLGSSRLLSPALNGRSLVIFCHLRALGIFISGTVGYICYRGKEPGLNWMKTGRRLIGLSCL
jgi:hypothetical protein